MNTKISLGRTLNITVALAVIGLAMALWPKPAMELCSQPEEEGTWQNTDPDTRSLTRIELRFVCQDQIMNGQPYPPGPPWYVHVFGKCHPTDCNWGEVGAQEIGTGHIYAFYDQGFAKRYVYAKMSQYRPGQLWVYTWTDFMDPSRPDYGTQNWFRRQ